MTPKQKEGKLRLWRARKVTSRVGPCSTNIAPPVREKKEKKSLSAATHSLTARALSRECLRSRIRDKRRDDLVSK